MSFPCCRPERLSLNFLGLLLFLYLLPELFFFWSGAGTLATQLCCDVSERMANYFRSGKLPRFVTPVREAKESNSLSLRDKARELSFPLQLFWPSRFEKLFAETKRQVRKSPQCKVVGKNAHFLHYFPSLSHTRCSASEHLLKLSPSLWLSGEQTRPTECFHFSRNLVVTLQPQIRSTVWFS